MLLNYFAFIALIVNCGHCQLLPEEEHEDYIDYDYFVRRGREARTIDYTAQDKKNDRATTVHDFLIRGARALSNNSSIPEFEPLPADVTEMKNSGFLVSLKRHRETDGRDKHFCAGAILNINTILTNAHCLYKGPARLLFDDEIIVSIDSVILDSYAATMLTVKSKVHPEEFDYIDPYTYDYNIALIRLNEDIIFSADLKPAVFGDLDVDEMIFVEAFGWVRNELHDVHQMWATVTTMLTIGTQTCVNMYGPNFVQKARHFCAIVPASLAGRCKGGPLVRKDNKKLIGLLSFAKGCSGAYPYVYVKLQTHQGWIDSHLDSSSW